MAQHTAIYTRVSSKSQDTASQDADLKRWAAERPGEPTRWYRDTFTGTTMDRPGFGRLLRDLEEGKVARIVVWRMDRLGRTARGLTALFEDLGSRGVGLVSLKEGLDLTTPAGRLLAHVLASVAAYETEVRAERVLAGQAAARAAGKTWGGSVKGRRLKVTSEQEVTIRRLRSEGAKVAAIGRATGLSRPTIYRVLRSVGGAGSGSEAASRSAGSRRSSGGVT
jgi:DNA invertase Pin-like site-specific DNA recombinase